MLGRLLPIAIGCLVALSAVGCRGDEEQSAPKMQLLGLETYFEEQGYFEGTKLVWLDPTTLRPLAGRGLRLGDHTGTGILSPDGEKLAFGTTDKILLVDVGRLRRAGIVRIRRR